jgi:hypothetical protein
MLRVQNRREAVTVTEVLPVPPQPQQPPADPVSVWGAGTVLGEAPTATAPARPLSVRREGGVRNRMEALIARGREQKIQALLTQMRSARLPVETQAQIATWDLQFALIDPVQGEDRALALATLLFRVIRPALVRNVTPEEQTQLLQWEDTCREIVQLMLPEGMLADRFLVECEVGLREERLYRERCDRALAASLAVQDALRSTAEVVDSSIEQAWAAIRRRMISLQDSRRELHRTLNAEVAALVQEVDQLRAQFISGAAGVAALGREDARHYQQLESNLTDCRRILEELL